MPNETPTTDLPEGEITKRKVVMHGFWVNPTTGEAEPIEANDYVRPDHLLGYIEDAKTRWPFVTSYEDAMASEPDAGPGGYHGQTTIPAGSPDMGAVIEATPGSQAALILAANAAAAAEQAEADAQAALIETPEA